MQNPIVNVNGEMRDGQDGPNRKEATVSVFDRGYMYGDSLYEVIRSYSGKFFLLDQHLERLKMSAELCRMTLGQSLQHYKNEIHRTFEAFRARPGNSHTEAYARIIVSRGTGSIGFGLDHLRTSTQYSVIVQPVEAPTPEAYQKGMSLQISERLRNDRRALDPAMKSGNYLNSLLAYLEAAQAQFDDALLCNAEGHITEGTTFNVFYVRRGILVTPPLDIGILAGVTRKHLVDIARKMNIEVREVRFPKERLYEADEVFITSSIKEVFPIVRIDDVKIGSGAPGPITQKLHRKYQEALPK